MQIKGTAKQELNLFLNYKIAWIASQFVREDAHTFNSSTEYDLNARESVALTVYRLSLFVFGPAILPTHKAILLHVL